MEINIIISKNDREIELCIANDIDQLDAEYLCRLNDNHSKFG